jgi:hypothetical protein
MLLEKMAMNFVQLEDVEDGADLQVAKMISIRMGGISKAYGKHNTSVREIEPFMSSVLRSDSPVEKGSNRSQSNRRV